MRRRSERRGAAAIEFALIMPVVFLGMFAVMDYGWYFFRWQLLTDAVARGVRSGSHKVYDTSLYTYPTTNTAPTETTANSEIVSTLASFGISGVTAGSGACSNCVTSTTDVDPSSSAHLRLTTTATLNYSKLTGGLIPMPGKVTFKMSQKVEAFK